MAMRSYDEKDFQEVLKKAGFSPTDMAVSGQFSVWERGGKFYTVPGPDYAGRYPQYIVDDFFKNSDGDARNISSGDEKCFTVKDKSKDNP